MDPGSWEAPQLGKLYLHVLILKNQFFSRTIRSISIKLGTNHPWVNGNLNCSNKWPVPFQCENWSGHLKLFFSTTTEPEELKCIWKLFDIMQFQDCSNHSPWRLGGATIGKTICPCVYIFKKSSTESVDQFESNSIPSICR